MLKQLLRATALSSALLSNAANAQEEVQQDKPTLHASDALRDTLAPITDIFLETARRPVVVLSQDDLFPDDPFLQRRVRMAEQMGVAAYSFLTPEDFLPVIRRIKAEHRIGSDVLTADATPQELYVEDLFDTILFDRLYNNVAAASRINMHDQAEPVCLISSPSTAMQSASFLSRLAHLPARQSADLDPRITNQDIYKYVMLHEAAHCAQDYREASQPPEDYQLYEQWEIEQDIANNLYTLTKETEADDIALQRMTQILERDGRPAELAAEILSAVEAARSIGALRVGADIFEGIEQYPSHATHVFEGQAPFEYNEADVFLAIKVVTTITNMAVGYNYGTLARESHNPSLREGLGIQDSNAFSFIVTPEEASSAGRVIGHELPEIQYGTMRAIVELAQQDGVMGVFTDQEGYINTAALLSLQIMDNYINAIEEYHPIIANSSLAQDSYDQLMTLAENFDLGNRAQADDAVPDSEPEMEPNPDDPFVRFSETLETPTNAQEALILIRRIVAFYNDYQVFLEVQADIEFERQYGSERSGEPLELPQWPERPMPQQHPQP